MKKKIIFITLLLLIITSVICYYITFYHNKKKNHKPDINIIQKAASMADIKINSFVLQKLFPNKNTQLKIKAKSGQIYRLKNLVECYDVKIKFKNHSQKVAIFKTPKTVFDMKNNFLELSGGVKSILLNNTLN